MVNSMDVDLNKELFPPPSQQKPPALSWGVRIKKKLKSPAPYLGKFRPSVGLCCHQCTPYSLDKRTPNSPSLGLQNLLSVSEKQTRYRGWLVRRICCILFVSGCKVYPSHASGRLDRVRQSNRVQGALQAEHSAPTGGRGGEQLPSPYHALINTYISPRLLRFGSWLMLKTLSSVFSSVQVNLNHLAALHPASQQGVPLVYVTVRQSTVDSVLLALVLFSHSLRVPYSLSPLQLHCSWLRFILQKVGVVFLPPGALTEQDAELDALYSPVMTSMLGELLCEGQALSISILGEGGGGHWLARIRQLIKEGAVPDVSLVPVGISYDCVPNTGLWVGLRSFFRGQLGGSVRVHLAQPFSLKEMCDTGRCRVDGCRPLQDLLLPPILNRAETAFGQRRMAWILPSYYAPELDQSERDLGVALTLHLLYSTTSCMAVMSTSLVSSLLLHRHRKGVCVSSLCRDVAWLTEELLFRNRDVGFGGSLSEVVHQALTLLSPHLTFVATTSRKDPLVLAGPSVEAVLRLSRHAEIVTHTFIAEAVAACAVSAMLHNVSGGSTRSHGAEGDVECDVLLCQSELTERTLQLCHLLPPGFMPPCQSSQAFSLDAVDSLVRCGVLIMDEIPRDAPVCDFWKRHEALSWSTSDDPYHSDSDCEEPDPRSYKVSQPSQCPEMLSFLCSMLSGHLRALCWATEGLELLDTPLPVAECVSQMHSLLCGRATENKQHYECCKEEAARMAVRTLTDLGVLVEEQRSGAVFVDVGPVFQLRDERDKLHGFISQFLHR